MIYQTVTSDDFVRAFDEANRSENFSTMARRELFEWLEDYSDALAGGMQLDVIGICCDWSEYTAEELIEQFGYMIDLPDGTKPDDDEFPDLIESLQDHGTLIIVEHVMDDPTYLFME